ncbi:MAG: hypothetical protein NXI31_00240 [bacterium]|nr:hypothetical protein [bacterium]
MTKSALTIETSPANAVREPRPFLFLEPGNAAVSVEIPAADQAGLEAAATPMIPALVRSIVNFTIALQNRRALEHGNVQPIQVSVLNRRRRAARAWCNAILAGSTDSATGHAAATQWLPTLCGTGPDVGQCIERATSLIEFVRGAITATIFDAPADNLVPHARALHALETVLGSHFTALRLAARRSQHTAI